LGNRPLSRSVDEEGLDPVRRTEETAALSRTDSPTTNRARRRAMSAAAVVAVGAMIVAGCGSSKSGGSAKSSSGSSGSGSSTTVAQTTPPVTAAKGGQIQRGGTVTVAESPGTPPNYIFPMSPSQDYSVYNTDMQTLLYRPLYYFGENDSSSIDYNKSVGQKPIMMDGGTVAEVKLNPYTWSDGEKVDARDVVFWMNLIKAEKANWAAYVPSYFPDNVVSTTMPDGPTGNVVDFKFNKKYNATWIVYNELSQVIPMPIAWDKTSASGATPSASAKSLPDTTVAGAKAVYTYLTTAAKSIASYTTSPLWTVIDGPWKLSGWTSQGLITMVPNPKYTGPDKPYISKFVYTPFTSDTSEYDQLRSSSSNLQIGYLPTQDIAKESSVEAEGYNAIDFYAWGLFYTGLNFKNPTAGPIFKQLYIRQALEDLQDQNGWDKAYWANVAAPQYGPIPEVPTNPFIDTFAKTNPYPFSVSAATTLLKDHGWTVKAGGTDVCAKPGSAADECGPGVAAGAKLAFTADVSNGVTGTVEQWDDYKQDAAQAGIQLTISLASFDTTYAETTSTQTKWQLVGGNGWTYSPDFYPTGETLYLTGAAANEGNYSDAEANKLINATLTSSPATAQDALNAYQNYMVKDLPVLWNPNVGTVQVVSKDLGGTADHPNALEYLDPENWYYIKK
jgi:peptide/nickel transport system substrate-binding protein